MSHLLEVTNEAQQVVTNIANLARQAEELFTELQDELEAAERLDISLDWCNGELDISIMSDNLCLNGATCTQILSVK